MITRRKFIGAASLLPLTLSAGPVGLPFFVRSASANGLLNNIRAYWKMDEAIASGSRADATGNGFTATDPNANVAFASAGVISNCSNVDTVSKGLQVSITLDQRAQTTPFSVSLWFRQQDVRAGNAVISEIASGGTSGWLIYPATQSPTAKLQYYSGTDGNVVTDNSTAVNIDSTLYNHVVFGYDGTFKFIYLNGANLFNNVAVAGVSRGVQPIVIGNYATIPANSGVSALYDEIGYWFRVLTAADVTLLFNGGAGLAFGSFTL